MPSKEVKRERTCIGCGNKDSKSRLYRIVRCSDGTVRFDATGNIAGRGAYVCSSACLEAVTKGRLQKALRCKIDPEGAASIAEELEQALAGA